MKLSVFCILIVCGLLPGVFLGQSAEVGRRQPIPPPEVGLPATPVASLASPAPSAGISVQGRTGIRSNIEIQEGVVSTLIPPSLVYQNATISNHSETPAAVEASQEETRSVDLVPSFFVNVESLEKVSNLSLGEVAAEYKAMDRPKNVRVYTNSDVEELLRTPVRSKGSGASEKQPLNR
jgi:hypothetical protein